jgi:hypothetical protein
MDLDCHVMQFQGQGWVLEAQVAGLEAAVKVVESVNGSGPRGSVCNLEWMT